MNSLDLQTRLVEALCDGARTFLRTLPPTDARYAFVFRCDSGCVSVGAAVAVRAELAARDARLGAAERSVAVHDVDVVEWEPAPWHHEVFDAANDALGATRRAFEDGLDDVDLGALTDVQAWQFEARFFSDALAQALLRLKTEGWFGGPRFEAEPLLGVAFSDPGLIDLRVQERVSQQVNSPGWHVRVMRYVARATEGHAGGVAPFGPLTP